MKKNRAIVKKKIRKKIERSEDKFLKSSKRIYRKMGNADERLKARTIQGYKMPVRVGLVGKTYKKTPQRHKEFKKKIYVDYDVVICIPSHDRYEKVKRLLTQFHEQKTKYTFKIILLNDGSTNKSYDNLINEFPEIIYLKNEKPNGKVLHWYCYNQMWKNLKNIECHAILQMDDDFILCDNFLDTIVNIYFEQKNKNDYMVGISPHTWSFNKITTNNEHWWNDEFFVDGICLLDIEVIKKMNYGMQPVDEIVKNKGVPVRAWTQINEEVKRMFGYYYRTPKSLVYHDGNNDSKLHGDVRGKGRGVFTQKPCKSLEKYCNYGRN